MNPWSQDFFNKTFSDPHVIHVLTHSPTGWITFGYEIGRTWKMPENPQQHRELGCSTEQEYAELVSAIERKAGELGHIKALTDFTEGRLCGEEGRRL